MECALMGRFLFIICSYDCNWISELSPDQLEISLCVRRVSLAFNVYDVGWDWKITYMESLTITFSIICYDSVFIWPIAYKKEQCKHINKRIDCKIIGGFHIKAKSLKK